MGAPELWKTLKIDYHHPYVHRAYIDLDGYRFYLHMIHNTEGESPLFHKHKWPSAIAVLAGSYEMGVAYDESDMMVDKEHKLPLAAKIIMSPGSAYEMTERHGLHYVKPLTPMTFSMMVTSAKYDASIKEDKGGKELSPLSEQEKDTLFFWANVYWPSKEPVKFT